MAKTAKETSDKARHFGSQAIFIVGIILRLSLMQSGLFGLTDRPELATPLNSYRRLREGVHLAQNGLDPYSGVIFHETPFAVKFFTFLFENLNQTHANYIFILGDVLTAIVLGKVAEIVAVNLLKKQNLEAGPNYHADAKESLLITLEDVVSVPTSVQLLYLLHPYLMASCAAKTTTVFANLLLAFFILMALKKQKFLASLTLALATYQSFYPVMLLVPLIQMATVENVKKTSIEVVLMFSTCMAGIYYLSFLVMGESWSFIESTIGFIVSVPELTPNMGLFWYFFTEMFEHFRLFFICTFQLNCFVYVYPLAARLKNQPYLLTFTLIALTAIFKSYPSYGDVGFYMALLPTMGYLFPYMKQSFIVANMLVATTMLGPILYQLWIYNGSANANYFFAITLVYGTAQIFLVTDILFAHVKREFYLKSGFKALKPTKNGPMIQLT